MPLWNFTTQKASLKIKQLKYVWIIETLTTFHLQRPKRRRYVNNFLSHFSFCRISPQVLCKFVFPVYFPKLYPIISYQSSFFFPFGKKIHNFLWQIEHKEWKYKYHSFGNEFDIERESSMNQGPWFWKYVSLYSSRNLRRARCQTVVGYNEDNQPYHHIECIFSVSRYNANIL